MSQGSSYRTLATSGCFRPSPASCMADYGQRSDMDHMNFVEYVTNQGDVKTSTAVPAAVGTTKMAIPARPLLRPGV